MSENQTYNQLTLFAEASLASLTVSPGSEKARQMTVISGRNIAALLPNSDQLMSLARMCLESEQLFSTKCYLTWKTLTTPGKRLLFRLAPSMPRTGETEFSLWLTPTRDISPEHPAKMKARMAKYNNGTIVKNLASQVMWPTPTASTGGPEPEGKTGRKLATIVKLYPTPVAQDGKNSTLPPSQRNRDTIPGEMLRQGENGSLNPEFVEWLMGFPTGWTDLEASVTP